MDNLGDRSPSKGSDAGIKLRSNDNSEVHENSQESLRGREETKQAFFLDNANTDAPPKGDHSFLKQSTVDYLRDQCKFLHFFPI